MIQIRQGVFETNSSSCHSLVIKKNDCVNKENSINRLRTMSGILRFHYDDLKFGRSPFKFLNSAYDRLAYLFASYYGDDEKIQEIINAVKELVPEIYEIEFPEKNYYDDEKFYGDIDHESIGLVSNYLESNNISFKDFISNDKYIVIVDGDEYCEWEKMKESGLIKEEEIELEYNKWE